MEKLDRNSRFLGDDDALLYTIRGRMLVAKITLQISVTGEWDVTWIYTPRDHALGAHMKLRYRWAEYFENRVNEEDELWSCPPRAQKKPSRICLTETGVTVISVGRISVITESVQLSYDSVASANPCSPILLSVKNVEYQNLKNKIPLPYVDLLLMWRVFYWRGNPHSIKGYRTT